VEINNSKQKRVQQNALVFVLHPMIAAINLALRGGKNQLFVEKR